MPDARYIRVRNWEKFQHYKDRNPPWIKNYLDIDDASHPFSRLSYADQGRLQKIWRWAAKVDNRIPYDMIAIGRYLGGKPDAILRTIDGYLAGEWLQVGSQKEIERLENAEKRAANKGKRASRPLATRKQSATPEVEKEPEPEVEEESAEPSASFKIPDPLARLVAALPDKTALTVERIQSMDRKHHFSEGDFEEAREAAQNESVRSQSAVAISVLKARAEAKAVA